MENVNMHVLSYIAKDISISVARLGINTRFLVVKKKDYKNDPYLALESTPFQTMPMIFKDIKLEGRIFVNLSEEEDRIVNIRVSLEYSYHTFDGGYNGHQLGYLRYQVEKNCWDTMDGSEDAWFRNRVIKEQGLTI